MQNNKSNKKCNGNIVNVLPWPYEEDDAAV